MAITNYPVADLELRINNPYSLSQILTFNNGDFYLDAPNMTYNKSRGDRYFTVDEITNYPDIAYLAYGDSKWWWVLYNINYKSNPDLDDPFILTAGTTLLIPDLESFKLQNA